MPGKVVRASAVISRRKMRVPQSNSNQHSLVSAREIRRVSVVPKI